MQPKFLFGDIVVVEECLIGVIVKTWFNERKRKFDYDVYVRDWNGVEEFAESKIERYRIRHKELNEEEQEYQHLRW